MAMKEVNGRYIHVDQRDYSHLRYLMICGCGFRTAGATLNRQYGSLSCCSPNNHTILTVPESPMFNAPEAAVVTVPRLELVRRGRAAVRANRPDRHSTSGGDRFSHDPGRTLRQKSSTEPQNENAHCKHNYRDPHFREYSSGVRPRVLGCVLYGVSDVRTERYGRRHDRKKKPTMSAPSGQIRLQPPIFYLQRYRL